MRISFHPFYLCVLILISGAAPILSQHNSKSVLLSTDSSLRAPHASSEDLTFRDSPEGLELDLEDETPTPSESLGSGTSSNLNSTAVTPVHEPK